MSDLNWIPASDTPVDYNGKFYPDDRYLTLWSDGEMEVLPCQDEYDLEFWSRTISNARMVAWCELEAPDVSMF